MAAGVVIVKVREMMPAPHGTLQADQADHVPVQSVWHTAVLHACDSVRVGQAAPPLLAGVVTRRDRDCVPPPQVAEHADQSEKAATTQSTEATPAGHACVLHGCVLVRSSHAVPPLAAGVTTVRVSSCVPPPHEAEHADQADQWLSTQSTEHACGLHVRVWVRSGQAAPLPAAGVKTSRAWVCVPLPHGREHADQADHAPTRQSVSEKEHKHKG